MSLRNLTKVPKLTLVYFAVDKKTCVVKTKKLQTKDGEKAIETAPERNCEVTIKNGGKLLEAMVIAVNGKHTCHFSVGVLNFIFCLSIFIYVLTHSYIYFCYFR